MIVVIADVVVGVVVVLVLLQLWFLLLLLLRLWRGHRQVAGIRPGLRLVLQNNIAAVAPDSAMHVRVNPTIQCLFWVTRCLSLPIGYGHCTSFPCLPEFLGVTTTMALLKMWVVTTATDETHLSTTNATKNNKEHRKSQA